MAAGSCVVRGAEIRMQQGEQYCDYALKAWKGYTMSSFALLGQVSPPSAQLQCDQASDLKQTL